ncbi:MAG TPA: DUF3606 domain-containing protein [Verrucomicrobiales bacterium]|nr:DUF3606 domain-containing protein [Verrucomicrobiales bacterium]
MKKPPQPQTASKEAADEAASSTSEQRCIGLNHVHEVRYWSVELSATEEELREAVRKAGPVVSDVRRYLALVRHYLAN